jgi:septation ring formation regulator EzrA
MLAQNILIILGILFIFLIVTIVVFRKRKRKKAIKKYQEQLDKINELKEQIAKQLDRTDKIAKNEESRELFNMWVEEVDGLDQELTDIKELFNALLENNSFKKHSEFMTHKNAIDGLIFDFEARTENVRRKIAHYTEFELDNSRIALSLKTRVKEISNTFNGQLKVLEIYNSSFNQQIADAQIKIDRFETLQKDGEYVEGRNTLKECNVLIDELQHMLKIVINFQTYLAQLDDDIKITLQIKDEINKIGFDLNIDDFDEKMKLFIESKDDLVQQIQVYKFGEQFDKEVRETLQTDITSLDTQISQFKDIIEEKFTLISEIIVLKDDNTKLIELANKLIDSAHAERDIIIKLYELSEIKQIAKLEEEIELFNSFILDYDKLIEIIYNALEDYASLKSRIGQANKFLVRVIHNLETTITELRAIRSDELDCRDKVKEYNRTMIDIDLYLRKYKHNDKISSYIEAIKLDLDEKFSELKTELDLEPLNITKVRNLNDSVGSILNKLTTQELEKNIKQRVGSEYLLRFICRYNRNDEIDTAIRRLNSLYNAHDYNALLQEGYIILCNASPKGADIYKDIVGKVEVESFQNAISPTSLNELAKS